MYLFPICKRVAIKHPFTFKKISYKILYESLVYFIVKSLIIHENIDMNMKDRLKNIGISIKSERLRSGLSQEELAEKCDISRNSVSLIETGKINPTIKRIIDIANALGVDVNSLVKDAK